MAAPQQLGSNGLSQSAVRAGSLSAFGRVRSNLQRAVLLPRHAFVADEVFAGLGGWQHELLAGRARERGVRAGSHKRAGDAAAMHAAAISTELALAPTHQRSADDSSDRTASMQQRVLELQQLVLGLSALESYADKVFFLERSEGVQASLSSSRSRELREVLAQLPSDETRYALLCVVAIGQQHVLSGPAVLPTSPNSQAMASTSALERLQRLADTLVRVDTFYSSLGGLIGYQAKCLQLLLEAAEDTSPPAPCTPPAAEAVSHAAVHHVSQTGSSLGPTHNHHHQQHQQLPHHQHHQHLAASPEAAGHNQRVASARGPLDSAVLSHKIASMLASQDSEEQKEQERLLVPRGVSLAGPAGCTIAAAATARGLEALPAMAEILPLGGAGDRLGLVCESTGDPLPTAVLPYCGRSLLEALVRDLQAREYLYYCLNGAQHTTPMAIMTSDAKGNHQRVFELLESQGWFGRGVESFRLFRQPMVPVVAAADGRWLLDGPQRPVMKPGGHGAIWKLMLDEGVFDWLTGEHGREAAIVRQISNPLSGTDNMLLALTGLGYPDGKSFGFASCERAVGAHEGINVLRHRTLKAPTADGGEEWVHEYGVTCVEYTEFERLRVSDAEEDAPSEGGAKLSKYPANTNILYLGLHAAKAAVVAGAQSGGGGALPGMIMNATKKVSCVDPASPGTRVEVPAGRLECTMQNLADCFSQRFSEALPAERHAGLDTFVVFNTRRKVTSSAKRRRTPGSLKIAQTPEGSFLDLQRNAAELLAACGISAPPQRDPEQYLSHGPSSVFLYHPALGPLYDVIAQKLTRGVLAEGSELVLEVAEVHVRDLHLAGSVLISADNVMGRKGPAQSSTPALGGGAGHGPAHEMLPAGKYDAAFAGRSSAAAAAAAASAASGEQQAGAELLHYCSTSAGRVRLLGCTVRNAGVDWTHPSNVPWRHQLARTESMSIRLEGRSEFEARGVTFEGSHTFRVPDGFRMVVRQGPDGRPLAELIPLGSSPSWEWKYHMDGQDKVKLVLHEHAWWAAGQLPLVSLHGEDMGILI